jgi:hypothetical protein
MKRGIIILFALILAATAYAQQCDYDPLCAPLTQPCGCGGLQTRYTLCNGGCSDWYPCDEPDTETDCDDGADNDCDNLIDCADPECNNELFCTDDDNDGFSADVDCRDSNEHINPGADELCNKLDDNCDGQADEGLVQPCGQTSLGACTFGTEKCVYGQWIGCTAIFPVPELCNNLDDDCDGEMDEVCSCISGDTQPCGTDTGNCRKGEQLCQDGVWGACTGSIDPSPEVCGNSIDDDCDGETDETCPPPASPPPPPPPSP